jgi:hypothetical protein
MRAYRDAVTDGLELYDEAGVAPPLAVAAVALGLVLEVVALPAGSLHGSEALQFYAPVRLVTPLECRTTLAQRSQRSGWIACVLHSEIVSEGVTALTARATVLTPVGQA